MAFSKRGLNDTGIVASGVKGNTEPLFGDPSYDKQFRHLQGYIPVVSAMMKKIEGKEDEGSQWASQMARLRSLMLMLTDTKKKMKGETLSKCEAVLIKLSGKLDSGVLNPSIERNNVNTTEPTSKSATQISPESPPQEEQAVAHREPTIIPMERGRTEAEMPETVMNSFERSRNKLKKMIPVINLDTTSPSDNEEDREAAKPPWENRWTPSPPNEWTVLDECYDEDRNRPPVPVEEMGSPPRREEAPVPADEPVWREETPAETVREPTSSKMATFGLPPPVAPPLSETDLKDLLKEPEVPPPPEAARGVANSLRAKLEAEIGKVHRVGVSTGGSLRCLVGKDTRISPKARKPESKIVEIDMFSKVLDLDKKKPQIKSKEALRTIMKNLNLTKHVSPVRSGFLSPERKTESTPVRSGFLSPERKAESTPVRSGLLSPERKAESTPVRSGLLSPDRKAESTPVRSGLLSPERKAESTPDQSKRQSGILSHLTAEELQRVVNANLKDLPCPPAISPEVLRQTGAPSRDGAPAPGPQDVDLRLIPRVEPPTGPNQRSTNCAPRRCSDKERPNHITYQVQKPPLNDAAPRSQPLLKDPYSVPQNMDDSGHPINNSQRSQQPVTNTFPPWNKPGKGQPLLKTPATDRYDPGGAYSPYESPRPVVPYDSRESAQYQPNASWKNDRYHYSYLNDTLHSRTPNINEPPNTHSYSRTPNIHELPGTPTYSRTPNINEVPGTPTYSRTPNINEVSNTSSYSRTPHINKQPGTPSYSRTPVGPSTPSYGSPRTPSYTPNYEYDSGTELVYPGYRPRGGSTAHCPRPQAEFEPRWSGSSPPYRQRPGSTLRHVPTMAPAPDTAPRPPGDPRRASLEDERRRSSLEDERRRSRDPRVHRSRDRDPSRRRDSLGRVGPPRREPETKRDSSDSGGGPRREPETKRDSSDSGGTPRREPEVKRTSTEELVSPLNSLYGSTVIPKTGKGYGFQSFRIPKIKRDPPPPPRPRTPTPPPKVRSPSPPKESVPSPPPQRPESPPISKSEDVGDGKSTTPQEVSSTSPEEASNQAPKSPDTKTNKPFEITQEFIEDCIRKTIAEGGVEMVFKLNNLIKAKKLNKMENSWQMFMRKGSDESGSEDGTKKEKSPASGGEEEDDDVVLVPKERSKRRRILTSDESEEEDAVVKEDKGEEVVEGAEVVEGVSPAGVGAPRRGGRRGRRGRKRVVASPKPPPAPTPPPRKAKKHRNELEMLQCDIRDMFISEGVVTATGKRMCRLIKEAPAGMTVQELSRIEARRLEDQMGAGDESNEDEDKTVKTKALKKKAKRPVSPAPEESRAQDTVEVDDKKITSDKENWEDFIKPRINTRRSKKSDVASDADKLVCQSDERSDAPSESSGKVVRRRKYVRKTKSSELCESTDEDSDEMCLSKLKSRPATSEAGVEDESGGETPSAPRDLDSEDRMDEVSKKGKKNVKTPPKSAEFVPDSEGESEGATAVAEGGEASGCGPRVPRVLLEKADISNLRFSATFLHGFDASSSDECASPRPVARNVARRGGKRFGQQRHGPASEEDNESSLGSVDVPPAASPVRTKETFLKHVNKSPIVLNLFRRNIGKKAKRKTNWSLGVIRKAKRSKLMGDRDTETCPEGEKEAILECEKEKSPEREEVSSRQEKTSPEREEVSSQQEKTSPEREEVSSQQEKTSPEREEVSSQQEKTSPERGEVSSQQEKTSPEREEVSSQQEKETSPQHWPPVSLSLVAGDATRSQPIEDSAPSPAVETSADDVELLTAVSTIENKLVPTKQVENSEHLDIVKEEVLTEKELCALMKNDALAENGSNIASTKNLKSEPEYETILAKLPDEADTCSKNLVDVNYVIEDDPDFKYECKLCTYHGKMIIYHYKNFHPTHEMYISRLKSEDAKSAIAESEESQYVEESENLTVKRDPSNPFTCRICFFRATKPLLFYEHCSSHTGEYRYRCDSCSSTSLTRGAFSSHCQYHHKNSKKKVTCTILDAGPHAKAAFVFGFLCSGCNFLQLNRSVVEKHVKRWHSKEAGARVVRINMSKASDNRCLRKARRRSSNARQALEETEPAEEAEEAPEPRASVSKEVDLRVFVQPEDLKEKEIENEKIIQERRLKVMQEIAESFKNSNPNFLKPDKNTITDVISNKLSQVSNRPTLEVCVEKKPESVAVQSTTVIDSNLALQAVSAVKESHVPDPEESDPGLPVSSSNSSGSDTPPFEEEPDDIVDHLGPKKTSNIMDNIIQRLQSTLVNRPSAEPSTVTSVGPFDVERGACTNTFTCRIDACMYTCRHPTRFVSHVETCHPSVSWDGVCRACPTPSTPSERPVSTALLHLLRVHLIAMATNHTPPPPPPPPDTPKSYIRMRRLSGDKLSNAKDADDAEQTGTQADDGFPLIRIESVVSLNPDLEQTAVNQEPSDPLGLPESVTYVKESGTPTILSMRHKQGFDPAYAKELKISYIYEEMLTHKKLRHLYKCMDGSCSFTTNVKKKFEAHIIDHEKPTLVITPGKKKKRKRLTGDWQRCPYCCQVFGGRTVAIHIDRDHGNCLYQCAYCFHRAMSPSYIFLHQNLSHVEANISILLCIKSPGLNEPTEEPIARSELVLPFICRQGDCNEVFYIVDHFEQHLLQSHSSLFIYTCNICENQTFNPKRLIGHYRLHNINAYQCVYCLTGTLSRDEMHHHMCNCHSNRPPVIVARELERCEDKGAARTAAQGQLARLRTLDLELEEPVDPRLILPPREEDSVEEECGAAAGDNGEDSDSGSSDLLVIDAPLPRDSIDAVLDSVIARARQSAELDPVIDVDSFAQEGTKSPSQDGLINMDSLVKGGTTSPSQDLLFDIDSPATKPPSRDPLMDVDSLLQGGSKLPSQDLVIDVDSLVQRETKLSSQYKVMHATSILKKSLSQDPVMAVDSLLTKSSLSQDPVMDVASPLTKSLSQDPAMDTASILTKSPSQDPVISVDSSPTKPPSHEMVIDIDSCSNDSEAMKPPLPMMDTSSSTLPSLDSSLEIQANDGVLTIDLPSDSDARDVMDALVSLPSVVTRQATKAGPPQAHSSVPFAFGSITADELDKTGLSGEDLYKCGYSGCSYPAADLATLKDHLMVCDFSRNSQSLKCHHCKKNLKHLNGFYDHISSHSTARFGCGLCPFRSTGSKQVRNHLRQRHRVLTTVCVPLDPTEWNSQTALFVVGPKEKSGRRGGPRKTANSGKKKLVYQPHEVDLLPRTPIYTHMVSCGVCSFTNKVRINMVRHLKFHDSGISAPPKCPINPVPCLEKNEMMFDKMTNLAASSHAERKPDPVEGGEGGELPRFVPESERYVCGARGCSYASCDENMLLHHVQALHREETDIVCPHCPGSAPVPVGKLGTHLKMHDARLYRCGYCPHHHHQRHQVERHLAERHRDKRPLLHTVREPPAPGTPGEAPWQCNLCDTACATRAEVVTHTSSAHGIKSQFKCGLCQYRSSSRQNFDTHFAHKHSGRPSDMVEVYSRVGGAETVAFDTTPLWRRDMVGVKHIRGILLDEEQLGPEELRALRYGPLGSPLPNSLFNCTICNAYSTKFRTNMRDHLYRELQYVKFQCAHCDMKTCNRNYLQKHIPRAHPNEITSSSMIPLPVDKDVEEWVEELLTTQAGLMKTVDSQAAKQSGGKTIAHSQPSLKSPTKCVAANKPTTPMKTAVAKQSSAKAVPPPVKVTQPPTKAEPSPVKVTQPPAKAEPSPAVAEPPPVKAETPPVKVVTPPDEPDEEIDVTSSWTWDDVVTATNLPPIIVEPDAEPGSDPEVSILAEEPAVIVLTDSESTSPPKRKKRLVVKKFPCSHCGDKFATIRGLKCHIKLNHLAMGRWRCSMCKGTHNSEIFMKTHCASKHPEVTTDQYFPNPNADVVLSDAWWAEHYNISHLEKEHKLASTSGESSPSSVLANGQTSVKSCAHCDFKSKSASEFRRHEMRHWIQKPYRCGYCDFNAIREFEIKQHSAKIHPFKDAFVLRVAVPPNPDIRPIKTKRKPDAEDGSQTPPPTAGSSRVESESSRGRVGSESSAEDGDRLRFYKCHYCPFRGDSMETTYQHWQSLHQHKVFLANGHTKSGTGLSFKCNEINFRDKNDNGSTRQMHMTCGYCSKKGSHSYLTLHQQEAHPGRPFCVTHSPVSKYECSECEFTANTSITMKKHWSNQHGHLPLHFTVVQEKTSARVVKPDAFADVRYACAYCEESADTVAGMIGHLADYHSHLEQRYEVKTARRVNRFKCPLCAFLSADHSRVGDHLRVHSVDEVELRDLVERISAVEVDEAARSVARKSTTPRVARRQVACKSTVHRPGPQREFSYYGLRPPVENYARLKTLVQIGAGAITISVESMLKGINMAPTLVVKDVGNLSPSAIRDLIRNETSY